MQELIDSGLGKLENKPRGVTRNAWSRFPVSVINSFVCKQMKSIFALSHFESTAVFLVDSRTWNPLRNRSLMILHSNGINFKISIGLVNSICC